MAEPEIIWRPSDIFSQMKGIERVASQQNIFGSKGLSPQYSPMEKLLMRLNVPRGDKYPFDFMNAVDNPNGGNVVVFIIVNGKPLVLEDDRIIFPSDSLIGRLNLLR
jgi:hypothetical protein